MASPRRGRSCPRGASAEAAAIAAAHGVLKWYFPANATLDPARAASLAAIPEGTAKSRGIATGEAAAAAMIANRIGDNSALPPAGLYTPGPPEPGKWQLTPSCTAGGGVFLDWRTVTPFGVRSVDPFMSDPPPAITSRSNGAGRHGIHAQPRSGGAPMMFSDTRFSEITHEIDDARVYGGIHFRFDQDAGARLGRAVGSTVYRRNLGRDHSREHDREEDCDHEDDGRKTGK